MPDLVDCARLAEESAEFERTYELGELPRLSDVLADGRGKLRAHFRFMKLATGQVGAEVGIESSPNVICQRCMQSFALALTGQSDVEFADDQDAADADSEREVYGLRDGMVSLRELAEEELLLALPIVPACDSPLSCGRSPTVEQRRDEAGDMRRPFSALQDLLKKT